MAASPIIATTITQIYHTPVFPFKITAGDRTYIPITSIFDGSPGSIHMDRSVYLKGRPKKNERDFIILQPIQSGLRSRLISKSIMSDDYVPITLGELHAYGTDANGSFLITDSDSDRLIYLHAKDGIFETEPLVKQITPAFAQLTINTGNRITSGSFNVVMNGNVLGGLSWDHSNELDIVLNIVSLLRNNGWNCNYTGINIIIFTDIVDQNENNGHSLFIDDSGSSGSPLDYNIDFNFNSPLGRSTSYLNKCSWFYVPDNSDIISVERDGLGNSSSTYFGNGFPFFNSKIFQVVNNDLSQDGGSDFTNASLFMFSTTIKGYSYILANDSMAVFSNLTLDQGAILDVTGSNESTRINNTPILISGTLIGFQPIYGPYGGTWTTFYMTENFNGYINLMEGRSTLVKNFEILGGYFIDADATQDLHWTGEIHLYYNDHGFPPTIWVIANFQFLPDYFKIVVNPGESFSFGPGNWGMSRAVNAQYGSWDPITIGAGSNNGGELSFWREKDNSGNYTGNLLCIDVIQDYDYD